MKLMRNGILLAAMITLAGSAFGQCRDPWIAEQVRAIKGRNAIGKGDGGECNYKLYGSNWNDRNQLNNQMAETFRNLQSNGLEFQYEKVMRDLWFHYGVHAYDGQYYVGPKANAPYADGARTAGGTYWWHIPLPNNHVLVVARKCARGYTGTGPGGGCVR